MDLYTVHQLFKTEKDCHEYLIKIRWPEGVKCTYCESKFIYRRSYSNGFKCRNCNCSFSVTVGTIFHSSKLPLSKWIFAITQILAAKKGISSLQLSRTINVNKNTAWYMQSRIRKAMKSDVLLSGIVEVDETYIGGALGNMSRKEKQKRNPYKSGMIHKAPVLAMVERTSGKISLNVINHADGKTIKPILQKKITQESELVTDGFGAYSQLDKHFHKHVKMNHEMGKRKEGIYNLSRVEGFFSTIKRAVIGQYHKISIQHLQSYMDEIAFKKNIPPQIAFNLLLSQACAVS